MPIYLDPNPLNTCCSSAGPPLSLQIRLNSAAVFQFGQKLHPNLCMEGECAIRSLSGPYIFLHLVALCSFLWHPWVSPQLFWVWFFHTSGRECSTEPVLPSQCDSYPEKGRNCSSFQRKFFRVWFCLLCIFFFHTADSRYKRRNTDKKLHISKLHIPSTHFQVITDRNIFRH